MRAIDTNIIVRFLTQDDPDQFLRAKRLIGEGNIFVATSVMLEAEWVLRSTYGFSVDRIVARLRDFAGTVGVTVEDAGLLATALDRTEQGMDFADALHLGRTGGCDTFFSFDKPLAKCAAKLSTLPVIAP